MVVESVIKFWKFSYKSQQAFVSGSPHALSVTYVLSSALSPTFGPMSYFFALSPTLALSSYLLPMSYQVFTAKDNWMVQDFWFVWADLKASKIVELIFPCLHFVLIALKLPQCDYERFQMRLWKAWVASHRNQLVTCVKILCFLVKSGYLLP